MVETYKIELKKLTKKYRILDKINIFLLHGATLLVILMLIESFGIINVPFYEQRLPFSHCIFLNTWLGIPYIFIEKKIDARIREIESAYEKKSSHGNTRGRFSCVDKLKRERLV